MDPSTSPKGYWSVFKSFRNKKVPCILTIFNNNRFTTNSKEKVELFTGSFAEKSKQYWVINNSSAIPITLHTFTEKYIGKVIQNADSNSALSNDIISMCMLTIW